MLLVNLMKCAFEPLRENSLHPPGRAPADAGPPVLRSTVDAVYIDAIMSLCPREKFTHVCRHTLCVHARSLKVAVFLMSTAAEAVGVKGIFQEEQLDLPYRNMIWAICALVDVSQNIRTF